VDTVTRRPATVVRGRRFVDQLSDSSVSSTSFRRVSVSEVRGLVTAGRNIRVGVGSLV